MLTYITNFVVLCSDKNEEVSVPKTFEKSYTACYSGLLTNIYAKAQASSRDLKGLVEVCKSKDLYLFINFELNKDQETLKKVGSTQISDLTVTKLKSWAEVVEKYYNVSIEIYQQENWVSYKVYLNPFLEEAYELLLTIKPTQSIQPSFLVTLTTILRFSYEKVYENALEATYNFPKLTSTLFPYYLAIISSIRGLHGHGFLVSRSNFCYMNLKYPVKSFLHTIKLSVYTQVEAIKLSSLSVLNGNLTFSVMQACASFNKDFLYLTETNMLMNTQHIKNLKDIENELIKINNEIKKCQNQK